jgi:hypothetical protein
MTTTATKSTSSSAGERQAIMADGLAKEQPRIAAAVKNYLSYKLAQAQTMTSTDLSGPDAPLPTVTVAPAVHVTHVVADDSTTAAAAAAADTTQSVANGVTEGSSNSTVQVKAATLGVDNAALLGFARSVLQAINAFELPDPQQWGVLHPQTDEQLAVDRLDELAVYKVIHRLWSHVRTANAKPANLLGRSFLRVVWADLVAAGALERRLEANLPNLPAAQRSLLVDEFEAALFDKSIHADASNVTDDDALDRALARLCLNKHSPVETGDSSAATERAQDEEDVIEVPRTDDGEEEEGSSVAAGASEVASLLGELVWAPNVEVVLQARGAERRRRASEQIKREEQYAQELKAALGQSSTKQ